jgi:argininosuccinate lyase
MKIWQKTDGAHERVDRFTVGNDRTWDAQMARMDVLGSIAHCIMLRDIGLLTLEETRQLSTGLRALLPEVSAQDFVLPEDYEDIHSYVEARLTHDLGDLGKKIHAARSRNDQVLVDLKLWLRDALGELALNVRGLVEVLLRQAKQHQNDLLPGYTHLQLAMPSSFGLWFGGYAESLMEDLSALELAWNVADKNPLGSAAGFGSSFPVDRFRTTELLGFSKPNVTSTFAQMSRGRTERFTAQAVASLAETLGRLAMDCTLYVNPHFQFLSFPDEVTTGSSIMPHKKNPDVWELVRGHCNLLKAAPHQLTLLMANLPSGYHRDTQLTKDVVFPAIVQMNEVLSMVQFMMERCAVRTGILDDPQYDVLFSVENVNHLVLQGVPFRDAYRQVGREVADGSYLPRRTLEHSHLGSIGNPGLEELTHYLHTEHAGFFGAIERASRALNQLAETV